TNRKQLISNQDINQIIQQPQIQPNQGKMINIHKKIIKQQNPNINYQPGLKNSSQKQTAYNDSDEYQEDFDDYEEEKPTQEILKPKLPQTVKGEIDWQKQEMLKRKEEEAKKKKEEEEQQEKFRQEEILRQEKLDKYMRDNPDKQPPKQKKNQVINEQKQKVISNLKEEEEEYKEAEYENYVNKIKGGCIRTLLINR
ncbi:hypothetical protein IMG5_166600, partial [Ichthyophthirius multifiliis]